MKTSKQYHLYCLIVFVTSSKSAKIYLLDLRGDRSETSSDNVIHKSIISNNPFYSSDVDPHRDAVVKQFISMLGHKNIKYLNNEQKKKKTTCNRHFGSMFGTKLQKIQCIYDLNRGKKQRFAKRSIKRFPNYLGSSSYEVPVHKTPKTYKNKNRFGDKQQRFAKRSIKRFPNYLGSSSYEVPVHKTPKKYKIKNRFGDLTRGDSHILEFSHDYLDVGDLARSEDSSDGFASNYVDYRDLRRPEVTGKGLSFGKTHTKKKRPLINRNFRKVGTNPKMPKANEVVRAEESAAERRRKHRKLKRFQVIKNSDSNESSSRQVTSTAESEEGAQVANTAKSEELTAKETVEEVPRKKHKKKDKETSFSDVDDKYVYIQGRNRQYGFNTASSVASASESDSDADSRKRLPSFLPKRYHWKAEDIPELDNFWTNGVRG